MEQEQEYWGVFFRDGMKAYIVQSAPDEDTAIEAAEERDEASFEEALEHHADEPDEYPEPVWEDYRGSHYIEPITAELVEEVAGRLAAGIAVQVDGPE